MRWVSSLGGALGVRAKPVIAGGLVLLTRHGDCLVAVDAATGIRRWTWQAEGQPPRVHSLAFPASLRHRSSRCTDLRSGGSQHPSMCGGAFHRRHTSTRRSRDATEPRLSGGTASRQSGSAERPRPRPRRPTTDPRRRPNRACSISARPPRGGGIPCVARQGVDWGIFMRRRGLLVVPLAARVAEKWRVRQRLRVSQVHVVSARGRCGCARRCSGGSSGPARGGWGGRFRRGRSSATPGTALDAVEP